MKNYRFFSLLSLTLISIWNLSAVAKEKTEKVQYRLILPSTEYPESYDPLDADITNNMDLMKLRYLTPIEIDHEDNFRSSILKSFEYDSKSFTTVWKVKSGINYADGSPIVPGDIVLAIKRMALKRSEFPVLSSIKGINKWSSQKDALKIDIPGVRINNDTITIEFEHNVSNPFFQFSLSLFAIQPSKCFDLKTSKLICKVPPSSGYYEFFGPDPVLESKLPIKFTLRKGFDKVGNFQMPNQITLEYSDKSLPDLIKIMDDRSVARIPDTRLTDEFINQFRKDVDIKRLPKTAIMYLLLNPNFEAFKDKECRRIFVNEFRRLYGDQVKSVRVAAKSFSSPVMPGYLTNEQIEKFIPTSKSASCFEVFKHHPIRYMNTHPFWDKQTKSTIEAVGMSTSGIYSGGSSLSDFNESFVSNKTAILSSSVTFWPLDLASGFNMFFSPEMHSQLKFVLQDGKLSDLSKKLFQESDPLVRSEYYEKINIFLYSEALLNALSYYGDAYVSKASNVNRLPIATSEPNPWHLFSVK